MTLTDEFIENRVNEFYAELKKLGKITEKYSSTWFDPFENEYYDDVTFQSRSTPLNLKGKSPIMPVT